MKLLTSLEVSTDTDMEVIECNCGYHMGIDITFIYQVGHFDTECPACEKKFNTKDVL